MWDGITLAIFALLFTTILAGRHAYVTGKERKARDQYFADLKQIVIGDEVNADIDSNDEIRRLIEDDRFSHLPLIGTFAQRFWTDLSLLGWQDTWKKRATVILIPSLLVALSVAKSSTSPLLLAFCLTITVFVAIVGIAYFHAMRRHLTEFKQNLPQAIDSIIRAARAGVPVTNTFAMVADNLPGPLAAEFLLIDNWLKVGIPLREAMRDSAARVPLNEYRFFVVILIINQETGGKLSETLERLSETLRARQELALKIKAKTSEVRASATIVALLAPLSLAYMSFNSPKDFEFLINDPTGNSVLIYAGCSVSLGLAITHFMIKRVIR
ncbi:MULTISPECIES: type II secretion system F family protein [Vibrio]|uniref:Secretion system protein n=2 Tax=Vibrio TaxID=662 RepID=A0A7X4RU58_9VIBR|nr:MULTISPECIES: type II secretion system F family protein [Vibrio]MBF9002872.1 type II secretion system F family protein [Vibrio nitrifigilis]MZI92887.1 secretion system protein [Vibrio eleionomae]